MCPPLRGGIGFVGSLQSQIPPCGRRGAKNLSNLVANVLYPMSTQCLLYRKTCGRLVEDLPRLVNDIRYGSFIIVGLRGKLQKASDYFLFSREKIKELILLSYPVFLSARQDSYGRLF